MDDGLDCSEDKLDVRPRSIKLHPSYQPDSVQQHHDIALIELSQQVRYSDFLRPICLPEPNLEPGLERGKILSVCGWGRTDLCEYLKNILKKIEFEKYFLYFPQSTWTCPARSR